MLLHEADGRTHRGGTSGGHRRTTNNRMEIMAVVRGLEKLKGPCRVLILSDSQYVVNAISLGLAKRWSLEDWMETPTKPRKNADLWKRVLRHCKEHDVTAEWVSAQAGHEESRSCDELASSAAMAPDLPPDPGYEKSTPAAAPLNGGLRNQSGAGTRAPRCD